MRPRVIKTILSKDLRDAIRDARVLVAVLIPFAVGIFYNLTFDDDGITPKAAVVLFQEDESRLPATILDVVGDTIQITFRQANSVADLEEIIGNEDADLGLVIPPGFDAAVASGAQPNLRVIQPPGTHFGGDYVLAALEPALRVMAGQQLPATIERSKAAITDENRSIVDKIGLRTWAVFAAIVMMISMISMLAIPVILAEETEKRTLDALILVASYPEIIVAKALVGVIYVAVMVPLLLAITRLRPTDIALFIAAIAALSFTLIGSGLFLAGFFKNANQLNTWSGIILLPIVAPAFTVGLGAPDLIDRLASLLPTGSGTKLIFDSASRESLFSNTVTSFLIVILWGIAAYALLYWQLSRRQA
jgi:hypothetical protein